MTLTYQLISADYNQPISYFASDLGIFSQNYNMGHFSHSILVTEPDSVIGITKFREFWNFLESLESLCEYLNFGRFGQIGYFSTQFKALNSILRAESQNSKDSAILEFFGIFGIPL